MSEKSAANSLTSLSLLSALGDDDRQDQAWSEFMRRYGPRIEGWCKRWGLQDADASDVTQNVMLQLSRQMKSFRYDPRGRFRSWLKTVAWRAWVDFLKARQRNPAATGSPDSLVQLNSVPAKDDLLARLDEEADREILDVALARVRGRVKESTFEAFALMAFEGVSGAEAAARTGIKPSSAFAAKSRLDRMLSKEVALLDGEH